MWTRTQDRIISVVENDVLSRVEYVVWKRKSDLCLKTNILHW